MDLKYPPDSINMKNKTLRHILGHVLALELLTALLPPASLKAQSSIDSVFVDVRGAYAQEIREGRSSSKLRADYFNFHMYGHLTDALSFRIRQRMNVPIDSSNPFRATDWLNLKWQVSPKWTFSAGKGAILIGGYEYDASSIDVYFYSTFCRNLKQCYCFNVSASRTFKPGQAITFQISNSPLTNGFNDIFAYNLAWNGHVTPWWKTIWSLNMIEDPSHRMINYIALGNHWTFGSLMLDLDLMNRASFQQKRFFFTDYTVITKIIWSIGPWNLCGKTGYERNSPDNVDVHGVGFDTVIAPGTEYLYGGVGIEYFPLNNGKVRLHLAYFRDNHEKRDNIELGLKWRFDIW